MSKIVLGDVQGGFNLSTLNDNFDKVSEEFDKVLYRKNPNGDPNSLETDLDMNGKRIYNLPTPLTENEAARIKDVRDILTGDFKLIAVSSATDITFTPTTNVPEENVQLAVQNMGDKVKTLTTNVDNNTSNITTNTSNISSNTSSINALSTNKADYTALAANTGATLVGWIQSGAGAVARTLSSKLRDEVNVRDFGAKGDGTTVDTAAIQAAINAAAGVATVIIPPGTYITDAPITIPSNTYIRGGGARASCIVKLKSNAATKPFGMFVESSQGNSNINIEGITIDGNGSNNVDHGTPDANGNQSNYWVGSLLALINLTGATQVRIHNNRIMNSWGSGIWLSDCVECEVSSNRIQGNRMSGVALRNNTSLSVISPAYNRVIGNDVSEGVNGIHLLFGALHTVVSNNNVRFCKDQNRFPAYAYSGTYPNIYPSTGGFKASGVGGYASPAFLGDGAGVEITGEYTDAAGDNNAEISVVGNVCNGNQVGIRVEEVSMYINISGNTCSYNLMDGFFVFSSMFINITGNTSNGNATNGIRIAKLTARDQPELITITGNTVMRNGDWGIRFDAAKHATITGNNISGNNTNNSGGVGAIGLYASESIPCTNVVVSGNIMLSYDSKDKVGVQDYNTPRASGIVVTGNRIFGMTSGAVGIDTTITNNLNTNNSTT